MTHPSLQDTFYWPDQNRDDVSHMLDAQVLPSLPFSSLPFPELTHHVIFPHTILFPSPLPLSYPVITLSPSLNETNVQGLPDANQPYIIPLHFATDTTHRYIHALEYSPPPLTTTPSSTLVTHPPHPNSDTHRYTPNISHASTYPCTLPPLPSHLLNRM